MLRKNFWTTWNCFGESLGILLGNACLIVTAIASLKGLILIAGEALHPRVASLGYLRKAR